MKLWNSKTQLDTPEPDRLREIAGLELGTGLPVNPVSPEDAVEELLGRAEAVGGGTG